MMEKNSFDFALLLQAELVGLRGDAFNKGDSPEGLLTSAPFYRLPPPSMINTQTHYDPPVANSHVSGFKTCTLIRRGQESQVICGFAQQDVRCKSLTLMMTDGDELITLLWWEGSKEAGEDEKSLQFFHNLVPHKSTERKACRGCVGHRW